MICESWSHSQRGWSTSGRVAPPERSGGVASLFLSLLASINLVRVGQGIPVLKQRESQESVAVYLGVAILPSTLNLLSKASAQVQSQIELPSDRAFCD